MKSFDEKKIRRNFSGRDSTVTRRNLGRTNLRLRQSCSAGDTSLREGEIIAIVITNNSPIFGRGISINIFNNIISSTNSNSSLMFNPCTRTLDWYCG